MAAHLLLMVVLIVGIVLLLLHHQELLLVLPEEDLVCDFHRVRHLQAVALARDRRRPRSLCRVLGLILML